jgi:small-conductance mechanosensitive channel
MDGTLIKRVARPHLIRAALATGIAIVGLVAADSLGDPGNTGLIDKLTTATDPTDKVTAGDVGALAGAVVFLFAGVLAVRAVTRGAGRAVEQQLGDARGAPLSLIISVVGYVILVLAILDLLGVDLSGLLLGGAITGVVVGIAAQQTLGNVFAGMVLLAVRPFVVGERIILRSGPLGGEYEGQVVDMGLFYVDLETERGPVKLPNAGVLAGAIGPGARAASKDEPEMDDEPA